MLTFSSVFQESGERDFTASMPGDDCLDTGTSGSEFCRRSSQRLGVFSMGLSNPRSIPESVIRVGIADAPTLWLRTDCSGPYSQVTS